MVGALGCTDVDIQAPDAWGPRDPSFPSGRNRDFSAQVAFATEVDAAALTALSLIGVAGGIDVSVAVAENGIINASNVAGEVELEIPTSTSASLQADVVTGTIRVRNLVLDATDPRASVPRGTLGSGSGSITPSTVAGDVTGRGR